MMHVLALLFGLFAVPAVLLWLAHHLRRRSLLLRRVFWGGMVGWGGAVVVMVVSSMWPPVVWSTGARQLAVYWILLAGGVAGMAIGALRRPG